MNITILTAIEVRGGKAKTAWTDSFTVAEKKVIGLIRKAEGSFIKECPELGGKKALVAVYPNGDKNIYVLN